MKYDFNPLDFCPALFLPLTERFLSVIQTSTRPACRVGLRWGMTQTAPHMAPAKDALCVPDYAPLNRRRLIAPGPVEVSPEVLHALSQPQMHHRAPEGIEKLMQARAQLAALLGDPYEAVITTTSGTGAFEGALVSTTPSGAKVVNAQAGKFSERWGEMAQRFGYDTRIVAKPWGEMLDVNPKLAAGRQVPVRCA